MMLMSLRGRHPFRFPLNNFLLKISKKPISVFQHNSYKNSKEKEKTPQRCSVVLFGCLFINFDSYLMYSTEAGFKNSCSTEVRVSEYW